MEDILYNNKLAIVGAGGLGREIESWVSQSPLINEFSLIGFLDDNSDALLGLDNDYSVVGEINLESLEKSQNVIIAIASHKVKTNVFEIEENSSFNIMTYIHNNVILGKHVSLGKGVVLSPSTLVSCNTKIEKGVFINCGSQIGHDVTVGKYSTIMANVDIGGGATIGENVFISTGVIILPGVKIASNVKIGAGSVVVRSIKKEGSYFGNPAKKIF